jgi:hypothetical protein
MNIKKLFVGGIIGGAAHFLLGWLVWGKLLMTVMQEHANPTAAVVFRTEADMVWWAMIVGNLAMGFLMCYILMKANTTSAGSGAMTGAVVGLLFSIGIDCIHYAQMKIYGTTAIAINVIAVAVVTAIVGAIVGWYLGMAGKNA